MNEQQSFLQLSFKYTLVRYLLANRFNLDVLCRIENSSVVIQYNRKFIYEFWFCVFVYIVFFDHWNAFSLWCKLGLNAILTLCFWQWSEKGSRVLQKWYCFVTLLFIVNNYCVVILRINIIHTIKFDHD